MYTNAQIGREVSQGAAALAHPSNSVTNTTIVEGLLTELEVIAESAIGCSVRLGGIADKLFGETPLAKEAMGAPVASGALGAVAAKLAFIKDVLEGLKTQSFRLQKLV